MAVTCAGTERVIWQGLSTDTKPTDSRVNTNDVFFQTDTATWYLYNAVTQVWTASSSQPPGRDS